MSTAQHAPAAPIGGTLMNKTTLVCALLIAIMLAVLVNRFIFGLASVTNLNDGYPWGIWVVVDVLIGSAFACGGFSVAMLVYIFNQGEYHPLVRPALLTSLFGYTMAAVGVIFDLGRYWNFWHILWPSYANLNSALFETATCISVYVLVMWIEFSPVFLERWGLTAAKKTLSKVLYFVIALGTLLPMMHQSSIGTLLILMGTQVNELWQTPMLPLLYLLSAIIVGYGVILVEACLASAAYRRQLETKLLGPLSRVMLGMLVAYLLVRVIDLTLRAAWGNAFDVTWVAASFWLEMLLSVAPLWLVGAAANRRNPARLFVAGVCIMLTAAMLRFNGYYVGYDTGPGWHYFPSLAELMVTFGMIAIEVLGYIIITRRFAVLAQARAASAH